MTEMTDDRKDRKDKNERTKRIRGAKKYKKILDQLQDFLLKASSTDRCVGKPHVAPAWT